jgi:hypothetical protein
VGAAGLRANAKVCSAWLTEGHTGVDTEKETRWERRGQCVGAAGLRANAKVCSARLTLVRPGMLRTAGGHFEK